MFFMVWQLKKQILTVKDKMFGNKVHFLLNEILSRTQIKLNIRHLPTCSSSHCISRCHMKNSNSRIRIRTNHLLTRVILPEEHFKISVIINCKSVYSNQFSNGCQRLISTSSCVAEKKVGNQTESGDNISPSDTEDAAIKPVLETFTSSHRNCTFVNIVPGKGRPPEPPLDCCMSGCANCVWIQFAEDMKKYYSAEEARGKMLEEIESLENMSLKIFLKIELGLT